MGGELFCNEGWKWLIGNLLWKLRSTTLFVNCPFWIQRGLICCQVKFFYIWLSFCRCRLTSWTRQSNSDDDDDDTDEVRKLLGTFDNYGAQIYISIKCLGCIWKNINLMKWMQCIVPSLLDWHGCIVPRLHDWNGCKVPSYVNWNQWDWTGDATYVHIM